MLRTLVDYSLLLLAFVFTFLIPGLYLIENFFPKLPSRIKIALCPLLSLIVSTYLVYFISLLIGFSRYSIILCFLAFFPWLVFYSRRKFRWGSFIGFLLKNRRQLILAVAVAFLFWLALFPAIFTRRGSNFVMASSNWQDTAMHTGIIESLAQGNFPPQAPYYAGVPLNYYYFTDFHSALLTVSLGRFFPRVLVYTNPLFAAIFALAVYALAFEVTKSRKTALASTLTIVLFGNLIFLKFFQAVFKGGVSLTHLLANSSYSMEYEKLFQLSSMADYFLQNRPMMIGLPAVTLVILLLLRAFKKQDLTLILLSGAITGGLLKFQYFAVLVGILTLLVICLLHFSLKKLPFMIQSVVVFLIPIFCISLPFFNSTVVNDKTLLKLTLENFSFGPWEREKTLAWHSLFILANFHLPLLLLPLSLIFYKQLKRPLVILIVLATLLLLIPYCVRFTVYKADMFKFFYFMFIPLAIVAAWTVSKMFKSTHFRNLFWFLLVFVSIFTSCLTLGNSFFNKNMAYSSEEYTVGLWIRQNTPQRSVFAALPTVHTPITQIGGRLRLLSYINWPYSHGFNSGEDNVFRRLEDIKQLYTAENDNMVINTLRRYNINYLFYGPEERSKFPRAEATFKNLDCLSLIYAHGGIAIYEVQKNLCQ